MKRKMSDFLDEHFGLVAVALGIVVVSVLVLGGIKLVTAHNAGWHTRAVTATSNDQDVIGSSDRVASFAALKGDQRWSRVSVDQVVWTGNRYQAWVKGSSFTIQDPHEDGFVMVVVTGCLALGALAIVGFLGAVNRWL